MKKTTIVEFLLLILSLLAVGCASKKQIRKAEEQTQATASVTKSERVLFNFDEFVDTAKECYHFLNFEKVEYYPSVFIDSLGKPQQLVKSVTKANSNKQEKAKLTKKESASVIKSDTTNITHDSTSISRHEETAKSTKVDKGIWWLILIILLLLASGIYIKKRVFSH